MSDRATGTGLIRRLPPARGRLTASAPIGAMTRFQVGGPAEMLFHPADAEDLAAFLAALPEEVPVTAMGAGSNLLIRDGGIPGVTVRLGRGFTEITAADIDVYAGAGALDFKVALIAAEAGIAGLEFLSGVPGTIGGGFRTNAGAHGGEFKDILVVANAIDRKGDSHRVATDKLDLSYRHCGAPADWIFTSAHFRGKHGSAVDIRQRMEAIRAAREASQPIRVRTGGSTFANPPGHRAWQLIDEAGCRGLARGGAMVSEKHANFLINTGNATAADIEGLGEEVRRRVHDRFGVLLEWEIRRVGAPLPAGVPATSALAGAG